MITQIKRPGNPNKHLECEEAVNWLKAADRAECRGHIRRATIFRQYANRIAQNQVRTKRAVGSPLQAEKNGD